MDEDEYLKKQAELYQRQKKLLDEFLERGAISRAQYNKSYGDLTAKMEMLDVVDLSGNPTGQVVKREQAHAEGIMHRTSHVWLVRKAPSAEGGGLNDLEPVQILLQKRSASKDSFPGCYDISSAGHIPAGCGFTESAIRELKEELGVDAGPEDLIFCGDRLISFDAVFHGKPFSDRQYSRVFALWCGLNEEDFALQEEEVEGVLWMDLDACIAAVEANTIPHCIYKEELEMVKRAVSQS